MDELKRYCYIYEESYEACEILLYHLLRTGWTSKDAIEHIKDLIVEGVFEEIRKLK